MKKLLMILVMVSWCNVGNAREYCSPLNEMDQVLDKRPETVVGLMHLGDELVCLGKINEVKIYEEEFNKVFMKTISDGVPMNPKSSKNRFKICGQIHLNNDINNMANKEKTRNFNETLNNSNFFRIGKKNQWKKILSTYQINLIESSFKSKMKKFEYI